MRVVVARCVGLHYHVMMDAEKGSQLKPPQVDATPIIQPEKKDPQDSWTESSFLKRAKEAVDTNKPIRIAFLDVDSTLTGDNEQMVAVLEKLKKEGYQILVVTARGEEMLVNDDEFAKSDFGRPQAKLFDVHKNEPAELRDPEYVAGVAGAVGSNAILHQESGGYRAIKEYRDAMKERSDKWRANIMTMVSRIDKGKYLSALETPGRYEEGLNDIAPSDFRIGLDFNKDTVNDQDPLQVQRDCFQSIREFKKKCALAWGVKTGRVTEPVSDDIAELAQSTDVDFLKSVIDLRLGHDSNPQKGQMNILLTPNSGSKDYFVKFMIDQTCQRLGITKAQLDHVLIAGDSFADWKAGIRGVNMINDSEGEDKSDERPIATYIVPKKSRLTTVLHRLQDGVDNVSDESLPAGIKMSAYPITPGERTGWYTYRPERHIPQNANTSRRNFRRTEVVVADEDSSYSVAQTPPESIMMYLNEKYPSKPVI